MHPNPYCVASIASCHAYRGVRVQNIFAFSHASLYLIVQQAHVMPLLSINGIEVDFPFTPYPAQEQYMSKVIDALRAGNNALLESPTGTGKTLCLLCATLAWRSTYVAALQAKAHNVLPAKLQSASGLSVDSDRGGSGGAGAALQAFFQPTKPDVNSKEASLRLTALRAPRIVYASRTHSQLSQAVHELQRTSYRPQIVQLGSRDQLCVHAVSQRLSGSRLGSACRALIAPKKRGCKFHLPIGSPRPTENRAEQLMRELGEAGPLDIEELREFGVHKTACPWFLARNVAQSDTCEVLFTPYNYILDRDTRDSLDIDWSNDVLIVDEAHNIEDACVGAMSFDLTRSVRAGCGKELDKCVERGLNPMGITILALESLAQTADGLDAVLGTENKDLLEFRILRSILKYLDEFIEGVQFPKRDGGNVQYEVFSPDRLRKLLEEMNGPTLETYELFLELLDRAMGVGIKEEGKKLLKGGGSTVEVASHGNAQQQGNGNNPLHTLKAAIRILFETAKKGHEDSFRMVVHEESQTKGRTLSYWCFDAQVAMRDLEKLGLRCMMLTSGTLSPLTTFAKELGVSFPVLLENPHVISKDQVHAAVLKKSPTVGNIRAMNLSSAYRYRGQAMHLALGRTLLQVAGAVPDGMLVFFPSYSTMNASIETWKRLGPGAGAARPSTWEHLQRRKRVVVEGRDSADLAAAMAAHKSNVDSRNGSVLFAVCRGKISEGIDFSDEYGRAVVITGLPYPSAFDPRVRLKRELADARFKRAQVQREFGNVLSGGEWYSVQAIRAVNQALGRAIRHRNDYGAVLLCDDRFGSADVRGRLSKWLRPFMKVFADFDNVPHELDHFFRFATKAPFADPSNTKRALAARIVKARSATLTQNSNVQAATQRTTVPANRVVDDDLFARLSALEPTPPKKRKRTTPASSQSVVSWDAGSAASAITATRIRRTKSEAPNVATKPALTSHTSISQRFLAKRAAAPQIEHPKLVSSLRRNSDAIAKQESRHVPVSSFRRKTTTQTDDDDKPKKESRAPSMKELASSVFRKLEDQRRFVAMFRRLLTADKLCAERDGPLQSDRQRRSAYTDGLVAVREIVRFARESSDAIETCKAFLHQLRNRVPKRFQPAYDANVQHP